MKRWLVGLALIAPAIGLSVFALRPDADLSAQRPLLHFHIVTFTTFAAAVISILLGTALGSNAEPRHTLAAFAFALIGGIFFTHGFATPGALLPQPHPIVQWSAWLMLFGGGAIFALAGLDSAAGSPRSLSVRRIIIVTLVCATLYLSVAIFAPQALSAIDTQAAPWHRYSIFLITLGLWLFAAWRLWRTWRVTRNRVDGVLAFVAFWLAQASVSLHLFPIWRLSWWMYHLILLGAFLFTGYVLAVEYERAREFRLVRYYVATALIATALLGLLASALFAEFAYQTLVTQIAASTAQEINVLLRQSAETLPIDSAPADARIQYAAQLSPLFEGHIQIYDTDGVQVYPSSSTGLHAGSHDELEEALRGQMTVNVGIPDEPPDHGAEHAAQAIYFVETYAPLRTFARPDGELIGALVTTQPIPMLGEAVREARVVGLIIGVSTMGVLFGALLWIVRRADRIITTRTLELATAYANLRQSESIRDDLTNMIVHDLRNPLTTISASLDLLTRLNAGSPPETRARFTGSAQAAIRRITGLIDDMLTVSKIEAGELKPRLATTTLAVLLTNQVSEFAPQAVAENKRLTLDCPPDLTAPFDAGLVERVIANLVGNAFKYTDRDRGHIHVSACSQPGRVVVSVRDNGEGVPDDYKQRIFGKFVQAPNADAQPARKGSGLGLAFCRLVVEAHGGQIGVENAPGGGSDFVFWLPAGSG